MFIRAMPKGPSFRQYLCEDTCLYLYRGASGKGIQ